MRKILVVLIGLLLKLATVTPAADAAAEAEAGGGPDWPQWRGPDRTAISPQKGLLDSWPEAGPEVLWRVEAGPGYSGVSVSSGMLYTSWDTSDWQFLFAIDAASGKEIWRRGLGPTFEHPYGGGPRSTPLVHGDLVYAIGTQGLLLAADRETGVVRWKHDLVGEFGARLPSYGYSSSPLVVDDKLMVEVGAADAAFIAFDAKDGRVIWAAGKDSPAYSSPVHVSIGGISQVVFWSAHGLHAVATESGATLWDHAWETFCPASGDPLNTGTPIFMPPDRIFLSSGSGAAVIRVAQAGGVFRVEPVWTSEVMHADVNTALLLQDHIYGFDRGILESIDAITGETHWKARGFQRGSLIAADGKLLVLGETGNLALVEVDPERFLQRSSVQVLQGKNWTTPSLAGGHLYLRNQEEIVCLDVTG
jgi:outer membrane protein assembly factor BamB